MEIKFKFIYGLPDKLDSYFSKTFSFDEIEVGKHLEVVEGDRLRSGYTILDRSQYLGHSDSQDNELYQGDILKVMYYDAPSKIFDEMKANGDSELYLIFDVDSPYLTTCYRTHDEDKYYTGNSINGDSVHFLRYLLSKETKIVGNVVENPELLDKIVVKKMTKFQ